MLIDTHCHMNMMVKKIPETILTPDEIQAAQAIIQQASHAGITKIINVGTSVAESINCVLLAQHFASCYASIGIHPNDCTETWRDDVKKLQEMLVLKKEHKIVAIGECGIDKHYPGYDMKRQKEAFHEQIQLALEHDLALIVHTRDAAQETLDCLAEYKNSNLRGVIHCFSEDFPFAQQAIEWGFVLGIGGTCTYPKNTMLRDVIKSVGLQHIILETDAPFLPPQAFRGKQNSPVHIATIAHYIAQLVEQPYATVAQITITNTQRLFKIPS